MTRFSKTGVAMSCPKDTLAERLRRRLAKLMGSPRVGSNPTGVVFFFHACVMRPHYMALGTSGTGVVDEDEFGHEDGGGGGERGEGGAGGGGG